jgi:predicted nuclease with TOPRIM domain
MTKTNEEYKYDNANLRAELRKVKAELLAEKKQSVELQERLDYGENSEDEATDVADLEERVQSLEDENKDLEETIDRLEEDATQKNDDVSEKLDAALSNILDRVKDEVDVLISKVEDILCDELSAEQFGE